MARNQSHIWQGKPCVLCGGKRPAETTEHAPPKAMFRDKQRPKGLEVPACNRCNHGTADLDQLASFLAFSQAPRAVYRSEGLSEYELKVVNGTANNGPRLYDDANPRPVRDKNGLILGTAHEVVLTAETAQKAAMWAAKQSLALWFKHTGQIASHRSTIDVTLLSNAEAPSQTLANCIRSLGQSISLSTQRNDTSKQFSYKFQYDEAHKVAAMFAQYHGGFAFVSIVKDRKTAKLSHRGLAFRFCTNAHRGIHPLT